jgi:hypothetical protein
MLPRNSLRVLAGVLGQLHGCAKQSGSLECVGLLACPARAVSSPVTAACLLPAESSRGHAEVAPLDLKNAVLELLSNGLRPLGLWHSHGDHGVFHSATDDQTVGRLFPAMAESGLRPSRPTLRAPVVVDRDTAVLPLRDGRVITYKLLGPTLPDGDCRERACWQNARAEFGRPCTNPEATQEANWLRLRAGEVTLLLGIPEGAELVSRTEETPGRRKARLFSLVVNNRSETYAEAVVVEVCGGSCNLRKSACPIEIIPGRSRGTLLLLS